jgi:hypothetical protein
VGDYGEVYSIYFLSEYTGKNSGKTQDAVIGGKSLKELMYIFE